MYNHLLYGIAVTEFVDGKKVVPTIALIDWEHPENNQFHFTEEFTVLRSGGVETRRPDIVCFVNGIPLAVIEAKSPAGHGKKGPTIDEGISQSIRNQFNDEIPQLFVYSQLLLSINGHDGRYGTCHTPMKFWWHGAKKILLTRRCMCCATISYRLNKFMRCLIIVHQPISTGTSS
ncbi:type I restriction endonuclease [Enterobacter cloacae complex sp. 284J4]|uniref:type I restriction endonuclease n=1 Tax=Enterobacter cloacae complex sp. 284J4 TaxID=3395851 RepID=UPI003CF20FEB